MQMRATIEESFVKKTTGSYHHLPTLLLVVGLLLQACGGGGGGGGSNGGGSGGDTMPDAFTFATKTLAEPDTLVESDPVTISGISGAAAVSIVGGEYSINGDAYRSSSGTISNGQQIRVRVRSSDKSLGKASVTVNIGGLSRKFTVETLMVGRVEAETAALIGDASTATDAAASNGQVVAVGAASRGISITSTVEGEAIVVAYRSDVDATLEATINGNAVGEFALQATAGAFAQAGLVTSVDAGDVIEISSPSTAGTSETFVDYVDFSKTTFKSMSTVGTVPSGNDGIAVAANGDLYVSGGPNGNVYRVTAAGIVNSITSALASANGSYVDSNGNLFVAEYRGNAVRKITPGGAVSTFASNLDGPAGIWIDASDNVYVSLFGANFSGNGATVLKITPTGTVSTYASGGGLQGVVAIVGDENGEMYAANWMSGTVFKITGGTVTQLAQTPSAINHVCYSKGYIYIPSPPAGLVRRVGVDGTVEDFIGTAAGAEVNGPVLTADFSAPNACAFNADGTVLYVTERDSGNVHKIDSWVP